jgi:hypothetical protein
LQLKYKINHKITLSSSFSLFFLLSPILQSKACTNTKEIQAERAAPWRGEDGVGRLGLGCDKRVAAAMEEGRRRERGGCKSGERKRGRGRRPKGGEEVGRGSARVGEERGLPFIGSRSMAQTRSLI